MDNFFTNTASTWFYDNIYQEGNISRLPDFDVFSLLDIGKRNIGSHVRRQNGNLKCKTDMF